MGVYGLSVIAALTAQNTAGVLDVMEVPADFVGRQWQAVISDIPCARRQNGNARNAANIEMNLRDDPAIRRSERCGGSRNGSTSGVTLLATDAIEILKRRLILVHCL